MRSPPDRKKLVTRPPVLAVALVASCAALALSATAVAAPVMRTIAGTGTSGYSGDGGPATEAEVGQVHGMTPYGGGLLFVDGHRVRWVDSGGTIYTVAGNGNDGFTGDGGPATEATLSSPTDVSPVPGGVMGGGFLIADNGNSRIRWVNGSGVISTVAGCLSGCTGGSGDPATSVPLNGAAGVDAAGGEFLIAEPGGNRIHRATVGGDIVTVYGGGAPGSGYNQLNAPYDVVANGGGFVIADTGNNRVIDHAGTLIAGDGTAGYAGDGGPASAAQLYNPTGVELLTDGSVLIADKLNNRIRWVKNGTIFTVAGGGANTGDGASPTQARLCQPHAVADMSPGTADDSFVLGGCARVMMVVNTPPPPPPPPPTDTAAPELALSGPRTQAIGRSIVVSARCDEPCDVVASGTLSVPNARTYRLNDVTARIAAEGTEALRLKVRKAARKATIKALKAGKKVRARVTVTASDGAGNRDSAKRTVRLKRG